MPIYEFHCADCGREIESLQRIDDPAPDCDSCGKPMNRQMSATGSIIVREHTASQAPCCGEPGGCGQPGSCCGAHNK